MTHKLIGLALAAAFVYIATPLSAGEVTLSTLEHGNEVMLSTLEHGNEEIIALSWSCGYLNGVGIISKDVLPSQCEEIHQIVHRYVSQPNKGVTQ